MYTLSTPGFQKPEDIANRALHHLGADHSIDNLLTDATKPQRLVLASYTRLRLAELRRNNWNFAIKHAVLRPLDSTSMQFTPSAWSNVTTYRVGQLVTYDDGYGSRIWQNNSPTNLNQTPGAQSTVWDSYTGPLVAPAYVSTTSYYSGDMVYVSNNDGTYTCFLSVIDNNAENPATTDAYAATTIYRKDQVVSYLGTDYISLVDLNLGHTPGSSPSEWAVSVLTGSLTWVTLAGTLAQLNVIYPIGSGPLTDVTTANVYPLPYGFLRKAPQTPRAGAVSIFGFPGNSEATDWTIEGNFLLTADSEVILFRYVADLVNVGAFDAMFCEGLGARIAFELCEPITQSTDKKRAIGSEYMSVMREARLVNLIVNVAEEPELDDWIACRV